MKRLMISLCVATILLAVGVACANRPAAITSTPSLSTVNPATDEYSSALRAPTNTAPYPQTSVLINVDDVMKNPERYIGLIRIEGVVSSVSLEKQTIGLIDSQEFALCGVTTCPSFILPVRWPGPMPHIEDTVQVTGEVQKINEKFVFVAQALENIRIQEESSE